MLISLPCVVPAPLTLFFFLSDIFMRNRGLYLHHHNSFHARRNDRIEEHLGVPREFWADQDALDIEEQDDSDSENEEQPGLTDSDIDRHTEFFNFPNSKKGCCAIDQETFTPGDSCRRIKQEPCTYSPAHGRA